MLIRSTLGASFGVIFSVLLFKRRAWPAFVGFGFGAELQARCCPHQRRPENHETINAFVKQPPSSYACV
ncbi:hypothetical protein E4T48_03494 [Aureobasidium sp. EXF-10727]|nr:hypothetical protein E4T48_03494 [Aureobasidium sp. EXF-10727]